MNNTRHRGNHFIMIKRTTDQEDIRVLNVYALNSEPQIHEEKT